MIICPCVISFLLRGIPDRATAETILSEGFKSIHSKIYLYCPQKSIVFTRMLWSIRQEMANHHHPNVGRIENIFYPK